MKISENKLNVVKEESLNPFEIISEKSISSKRSLDSTDELDMPRPHMVKPLTKEDVSEYPAESMTPTEIRMKVENQERTEENTDGNSSNW